MPFKVRLMEGGPYIEASTAQEALDLIRIASNGHALNTTRTSVAQTSAEPFDQQNSFRQVLGEINDRARAFLTALLRHESGVEGQEFAHELKGETTMFGGILGGISKRADNHGISIDDLVISEFKVEGARRFRFLQPGPVLRRYAHLLQEVDIQ
jgi:ribosomal protein L22